MAKSDCKICYGCGEIHFPSLQFLTTPKEDGGWTLKPVKHYVIPCACKMPWGPMMKSLGWC